MAEAGAALSTIRSGWMTAARCAPCAMPASTSPRCPNARAISRTQLHRAKRLDGSSASGTRVIFQVALRPRQHVCECQCSPAPHSTVFLKSCLSAHAQAPRRRSKPDPRIRREKAESGAPSLRLLSRYKRLLGLLRDRRWQTPRIRSQATVRFDIPALETLLCS